MITLRPALGSLGHEQEPELLLEPGDVRLGLGHLGLGQLPLLAGRVG